MVRAEMAVTADLSKNHIFDSLSNSYKIHMYSDEPPYMWLSFPFVFHLLIIYSTVFVLSLQLASLKKLEIENQDAAHKLEEVVHKGELLLDQTQQALHDIAQSQLKSQALESMLLN